MEIKPEIENPLALKQEKEEQDRMFNEFIKQPQIAMRMEQWLSRNDTKRFKPPIYFDKEKNIWFWMGRDARKKAGLA